MRTIKEKPYRKTSQWLMVPLLPMVVLGGIYNPFFGYIALAMMGLMMGLMIFRGRFYCGWLCAMGSFHERVLAKVSLHKPMPPLFKQRWFRWLIFTLMMGLMTSRLIMSGGDPALVGGVFVMMWSVATVIAIALGLIFKPRSWCNFCPMATMQALSSKNTHLVQIAADGCRQCGICHQTCPVGTYPGGYRDEGRVPSEECMRCENCIVNCPRGALTLGLQTNVISRTRPQGAERVSNQNR